MTRRTVRRGTRSATAREGQARWNRTITVLLMVGFACAAGYYLWTGSDPLGLFTEGKPTPAPIVAGGNPEDWWRVFFTVPRSDADPDRLTGSVADLLIDYIKGSQRTIHIAAFEFDLPLVAGALVDAHRRGVEVRWVTDDEYGIEADEEEEIGLFAALEKAGIQIRDDGRSGLMHNKFWIFDKRTVWTGSTNVTANGVLRNNNNVIVIELPELAAIYEREFAEMWSGAFGPTSPSTVEDQTLTIDGTRVQVLFAPEDGVAKHLLSFIDNAQRSIHFMAFSFTAEEIGAAVLRRAKAGVDVKGILEARGSETEYSQLLPLYCAGVLVRQDGNPGIFHHKVIIIDDELVITGSFNFSDSADRSNDENALIVADRKIASEYLNEFQRNWDDAIEPDPAKMSCRQS